MSFWLLKCGKTASQCCAAAFASHPQVAPNPAREKSRKKNKCLNRQPKWKQTCFLN